ncbi:MAG TPA: hypothetical protein VF173_01045 [Thermoanaerobaculia bacterium]|nr:hypothetical protein [Thermoanaerobaculia bacterium]
MQIEHSVARSKNASLEDVYTNCYYVCERCNKSRGASPNQDDENNDLLNPCDVSWKDHFERIGDELHTQDYSLPEVLAEQTIDMGDLLQQARARRDKSGASETLIP